MTTTQKFVELASKNMQIGYVRFHPEKAVHIKQFSDLANIKIKEIIEGHRSFVTTDWDSNLSTIRVFTKRTSYELKDLFVGTDDHIKFISKWISNQNILKYPKPQYLVTDPVYLVKSDCISVVDGGDGQSFVEYFETHYEEIIEVVNSSPASSVRFLEFLEKTIS